MAVSTVLVAWPYTFSSQEPHDIHVSATTTVAELLQQALSLTYPNRAVDPADYALFMRAQGRFLYRHCLVSQYAPHLCLEGQLELRSRLARPVRVIYLRRMTVIDYDPNETVASAVFAAVRRFMRGGAMPASKHWSLFCKGRVLDEAAQLSELFCDGNSVPAAFLRLELPRTSNSTLPLFKSTFSDAFSACGGRVPPWFASLLEHTAAHRDLEGIYRRSGLQTSVGAIVDFLEHEHEQENIFSAFLQAQSGHDLAGVVKLYLRATPHAVIPVELTPDFKDVLALPNARHSLQLLKVLVACIPTPHYGLLQAFAEHIEVIAHADNQMGYANLAIVLGPTLFRTTATGADVVLETARFQTLTQMILTHWRFIFLNAPLALGDAFVVTQHEVAVGAAALPAGHRLRLIERGATEVRVEYNGLPVALPAAAVADVDDADVEPTFWRVLPEKKEELALAKMLAVTEAPADWGERLRALIAADFAEIEALDRELARLRAVAESDERDAAVKRIMRRLQQF
jgi:hypothetical protein